MRLELLYDGSGRRISKTRWSKANGALDWEKELVTHYTGIGTEVRENLTGASSETKVVVNMPQNLGRYGVEHADAPAAATTYAWFLHDHLGSTVAVYGSSENGEGQLDLEHAYEYRSFGEMAELTSSADKVTENFTGKEKDDEIELNYFGARYLDPMLGMWISVDPARQYQNPYLYAGNNPIMRVDPDGNQDAQSIANAVQKQVSAMSFERFVVKPAEKINETTWNGISKTLEVEGKAAKYTLEGMSVVYPAAKPAVVALDAIEGYAENGWDGAGYAVLFDLTLAVGGKMLPKNTASEVVQTVAGEVIGGKLQENLKEARMMRGIDWSSERDIIEFPESPLDNTKGMRTKSWTQLENPHNVVLQRR